MLAGLAPGPSHFPSMRHNQTIRVGLTTDRQRITISSFGKFCVVEPDSGRAVWKDSYEKPLMVGIRGAPPTEGRIYRVQVGSFDTREAAEALAARLRTDVGEPVVVAWLPDRKVWRVRVGAAGSREALAGVVSSLRAGGYAEIWITEEAVPQTQDSTLILVDPNYDTHAVEAKVLAVAPCSSDTLLAVDGDTYHGTLEVRLDASGGIRVVNVVPVESYLRGVVPAELGPAVYPELEALKAQAVAARTYVYRNIGQFADEGFDL
ncbi:MAG: SpoIID/LytB domain-containing protein, partial [Thermoplasmata archaeon]